MADTLEQLLVIEGTTPEQVIKYAFGRAYMATFGGSSALGIFSENGEMNGTRVIFTQDVIENFGTKDHDPANAQTITKDRKVVVEYKLDVTKNLVIQIPDELIDSRTNWPELAAFAERVFAKNMSKAMTDIEREKLWGSIKTAVGTAVPFEATSGDSRIVTLTDLFEEDGSTPLVAKVTAVSLDVAATSGEAIALFLETQRDTLAIKVSDIVDITDNDKYAIFIDAGINRKLSNAFVFRNNSISTDMMRMGFKNTVGQLSLSTLFQNDRMGNLTSVAPAITDKKVVAIIAGTDAVMAKWIAPKQWLRALTDSGNHNAITEVRSTGGVTKPTQIIVVYDPT